MAFDAYVGSFNLDTGLTATQTQAITGVGFEPKLVIFWYTGSTATSDTTAGGDSKVVMAAATSASNRYCAGGSEVDAQATSAGGRFKYTDRVIHVIRGSTAFEAVDGYFDFSSMDSDGFTLIVDDAVTVALRISYLALGGSDLTNVYLAEVEVPSSTGNWDYTSVGFQPDAAIFFSSGMWYGVSDTISPSLSVGMAVSSSAQGVASCWSRGQQLTTETNAYNYSGEVLASGRGPGERDTFVSFLSNGFRLNHLEGVASTYSMGVICLKGGQYTVGNLTTRTDANDIVESGFGFQPEAILFASANRSLSTQDVATADAKLSIGAATSTTNRAVQAFWSDNAAADVACAYANYDSAVYAHVDSDSIVALMDIKSIDSGGFTCVMDDTEPTTASWVTYVAFGPSAAVDARIPKVMLPLQSTRHSIEHRI